MKARKVLFGKKVRAGTAVKLLGDSQEMPDVPGKTPSAGCQQSHCWNLTGNLLARAPTKGSF